MTRRGYEDNEQQVSVINKALVVAHQRMPSCGAAPFLLFSYDGTMDVIKKIINIPFNIKR